MPDVQNNNGTGTRAFSDHDRKPTSNNGTYGNNPTKRPEWD
ncbi:MAG: hypothetical protein ACRDBP_13985 [Luteolibacter sp.]